MQPTGQSVGGDMTQKIAELPTRSEATAARIVAAARGLFVASTYADVTTEMIARAAEVTKGGLYHHFASKEQLYFSMMLEDFERKRRLFGQAVCASGTCRDRLARLTRDFLELPDEERELARLVRRDINTFTGEKRDRLVRAYQQALPEQVESIIRDGIEDGELARGDARILSWSFVALVEVVIGEYADRVFGSTEARLDHVLGLFFEGAAAKPLKGTV
ncbi:MAG TPA: TetR/AcrR family transcriptional regulator [Actinobacteria bacterium]|nr:TetR/AcrR family transcriptional regulator [Actinomycetota bacterium]